jgi:hypothetical protein
MRACRWRGHTYLRAQLGGRIMHGQWVRCGGFGRGHVTWINSGVRTYRGEFAELCVCVFTHVRVYVCALPAWMCRRVCVWTWTVLEHGWVVRIHQHPH